MLTTKSFTQSSPLTLQLVLRQVQVLASVCTPAVMLSGVPGWGVAGRDPSPEVVKDKQHKKITCLQHPSKAKQFLSLTVFTMRFGESSFL